MELGRCLGGAFEHPPDKKIEELATPALDGFPFLVHDLPGGHIPVGNGQYTQQERRVREFEQQRVALHRRAQARERVAGASQEIIDLAMGERLQADGARQAEAHREREVVGEAATNGDAGRPVGFKEAIDGIDTGGLAFDGNLVQPVQQ